MKEYKFTIHRTIPGEIVVIADNLKEAFHLANYGEFKELDFYDEYERDKVFINGAQVLNQETDEWEEAKN